MITTEQAWQAVHLVPDPEIPVISVTDLGIVREIQIKGEVVHIALTPTYSGCPATQEIQRDVEKALMAAGASSVQVELRLSPAWTTDWINPEAKEKLKRYGMATPSKCASANGEQVIRFVPTLKEKLNCPLCNSSQTERISEFGSTACKALYRCLSCREPFEFFKPI